MFLEGTPAVHSLEKLCDDHGYTNHSVSGQNPHLIKNGKRINCNFSYSASSSSTTPSPASSPSSSQESTSANSDSVSENRDVEAPVSERNTGMNEELRGDPLHESTETEKQNKNREREEVQRDIWHELPDWLQEFIENLVDESTSEKRRRDLMQRSAHTSSSTHYSPMEPRAHVEPGSGKHSVFTHFPTNPNCDLCLKPKRTRASCTRRADAVVPRAEIFGDLITADHKVPSEESESRNNHRFAVVVQNLATQGSQSNRCKTKSSQETSENLTKFLEPSRKPKVIYADISLEFGKSCEESSRSHCTSTPHRSETKGIAERAVRRVQEETSAVLLQSGLTEEWWADFMECYCYLRNIQDLLSGGKTPYERLFGMPFNGPVIPFGAMVEYHPISANVKAPSIREDSLTWNIPRICIVCGRNVERRHYGRRH